MIAFFSKLKPPYLLILIIAIGGFLRFYKLDWGQGLFAHPDEYHIVASVNQLSFPNQMHPHFFSYGTVTIYLIYLTQELLKSISSVLSFQFLVPSSFLLGRFYSALFSALTIFIVYGISRTFLSTKLSLLAALLVALIPGLIQQAHFATPESAQIFFLFTSLLFMIRFIQHGKFLYLALASVFLGLALGVKISSIVFLLPLVLSIILSTYFKRHSGLSRISNHLGDSGCAAAYQNDRKDFRSFRKPFRSIMLILTSLLTIIATFALVAPFVFLDFPAFRGNLEYEGGLAIGKIPVFYTRQFIDTIPIVFQMEKIFPYALGPVILILGIAGFILVMLNLFQHLVHPSIKIPKLVRDDNEKMKVKLLIILSFLSLFLPNAFLFAKWTRFIAPIFPFFGIFAVISIHALANQTKRSLYYLLTGLLIAISALWTIAFFSIYTNRDIRITASEWLEAYAKPGSSFLVEGGNTVDLPLKGNFQRISLDFYTLENDPMTREKIINALYSSDYFLVQSRRVFMNHQKLATLYPKTSRFYDALFDGRLEFKQVIEFHSFPMLAVGSWKLEVADESAEETWSVFDHPVIRVFKKNAQLTREEYSKFLEI